MHCFSKSAMHCIDQGSVLHVHSVSITCTVLIFCFRVFVLTLFFSNVGGVHCLVNHSCTALIMFLYCTFIYFRTTYRDRIFLFVFFSYLFVFPNLGVCTALLGMCKLHLTESVLHWYKTCTACVLFAHCSNLMIHEQTIENKLS